MNKKNQVYIEKYRPKTLDDVVGQEQVVSLLKGYVKNKRIPHLMFTGPAGIGKTTCAIALARELYGPEWKDYFIEINASDDNSIKNIRENVKGYARVSIIGQEFKIIFLDEADHITQPAQAALRRIIEMYSDRCRFILSCNYPNKVLEPILDRFTTFRFKHIKPDDMMIMLKKVVQNENIDISEPALQLLAELSNGSMRKSLSTLEKLKLGNITNINEETIKNNFCYVDDNYIKESLAKTIKGDIDGIHDFVDDMLYEKTYVPDEILESFDRLIRKSKVLSNKEKVDSLLFLGEIEFRIAEGARPDIQLKTFVALLYKIYSKGR